MDSLLNKFYSDAWLKDLLDNAHDLIHIVHEDGTLLYANRTWARLLGYQFDDIQNQSIFRFIHPDDRESFKAYRERLIKAREEGTHVVVRVLTATGKELQVEGILSVMEKDGMVYTTGIFRDITERLKKDALIQQSYHEIEEKEKNLYQLLQHGPDAVIVIDKGGRVIFWNKKANDIFGWSYQEVVGKLLSETIIPVEYRHAHTEGMKRFLSTGEAHVLNTTIEISALNKSGAKFFVALTISQTIWKGEVAFIAFIRDISVQKKAQLELEEKKQELETSNKHLEQFAHVASHDMKEPIRRIKVFTDMLQVKFAPNLPEEARDYLNKIDGSCGRLIDMVTGVLTYSSIQGANEPLQMVSLAEIISSIEEDLDLVIGEKQASVIYDKLPLFKGIPFLVYQLFYNLINNALKFSKEDVPSVIEIKSRLADASELPKDLDVNAGPYIMVSVCDNGIGFEPKNAEIIFDNFTRLHSKDQYEGTGLGLAIARYAAERQGGQIVAHSVPNEGSCFDVFFPAGQV